MGVPKRPRTERKRAEVKTRIVVEAGRQFAERGFDAVRIEELAEGADIARATLYSHFDSKEDIAREVLVPMLAEATVRVEALRSAGASEAMDGLLDVYVWMWTAHRDALRVAYRLQEQPLMRFALTADHQRFVAAVVKVFEKAQRARVLRVPTAMLGALTLSKVGVPLLGLYASADPSGALFKAAVRGLLFNAARKP